MDKDVVIVGGGPGGLAAALTLGRARRQVLLCDSGPRRNELAVHMHNFVTRDGIPPAEFRRIGREQLTPYRTVELRDERVKAIRGARGAFDVDLPGGTVRARRILLCTGMIDERLPVEGFEELWGHAIYQCPYCHGFEVADRRWGYFVKPADAAHLMPFALMVRGWTDDIVAFTNGAFDVPPEDRARLAKAGVRLETRRVERLVARGRELEAVELEDGERIARDVLFAHPPQQQVPLVRELGLALDADGFVKLDERTRQTSVPGIYAAGDLTTRMQAAVGAAAAAMMSAAMINADLAMDA